MEVKKKPEEIFREYERGVQYNQRIGEDGLYEAVERYENFYIGRHWEGVNAPEMEKPVLNFTHRVISYLISMLVADDIGVSLTPFRKNSRREAMCKVLSRETERVIERSRLKTEAREALRGCAVDGDTAIYFYLDGDRKTGEAAKGEIACEIVENTKVLFGNPFESRVERQPYLLIVRRRLIEEARRVAEEDGRSREETQRIRPDGESRYGEDDQDDRLVTCIVKLWKENGTVRWMETCRETVIQKERDTGYRRYPVAWMSWEAVRSSYHGHSAMEGMIPNQIFVNKLWAMMMIQVKNMAFPKIFYNRSIIKKWTSRVGDAIGIEGSPDTDMRNIAQSLRAGDFSAQAMDLVEKTISYTKDYMGANDVALGDVRPENTSAIIAVQKASSAPLELQRLAYFQLMEDCVRIMLEIMRCDYGVRTVTVDQETAQALGLLDNWPPEMAAPDSLDLQLDFSGMDLEEMELNVDVGTSSYWSEITQQQSADNLLKAGILQDAADYVERIPDKWVKDKAGLLKKLKERQQQLQTAQQQTPREQLGLNPMENGGML